MLRAYFGRNGINRMIVILLNQPLLTVDLPMVYSIYRIGRRWADPPLYFYDDLAKKWLTSLVT